MEDAPRIDPEELKRRLDSGDDLLVLDVRRGSWHRSDVKIPGAVRMELEEALARNGNGIPEGGEVVTYCT